MSLFDGTPEAALHSSREQAPANAPLAERIVDLFFSGAAARKPAKQKSSSRKNL